MDTVEQIIEMSLHGVADDTKLRTLGVDSVKLVQVAAHIEETTGKAMYQSQIYELTVGQVKEMLSG